MVVCLGWSRRSGVGAGRRASVELVPRRELSSAAVFAATASGGNAWRER